jgi:hydroxymethylpyrimidine pyrophosphatase-like HAD family hydrolase
MRPVAPWTEATMMFEGLVDPVAATTALAEAGYGWLELHDNGRMRRQVPTLDVPEIHALHLLPRGVTKASAVRLHRERHGMSVASVIAIGDSPSDLIVAAEVGAFFLVANGAASADGLSRLPENAYMTVSANGDGFAEAVRACLVS